jgi:hypothetical protein
MECKIREIPNGNYSQKFDTLEISFENRDLIIGMDLTPIDIDYVLPLSESNEETKFSLPIPYSIITAFKVSILSFIDGPRDFSFPALNAEISYYDNINTLYKEEYRIESNISIIQWEYINEDRKEKTLENADFYIVTKKKNKKKFCLEIIEKFRKKMDFINKYNIFKESIIKRF